MTSKSCQRVMWAPVGGESAARVGSIDERIVLAKLFNNQGGTNRIIPIIKIGSHPLGG